MSQSPQSATDHLDTGRSQNRESLRDAAARPCPLGVRCSSRLRTSFPYDLPSAPFFTEAEPHLVPPRGAASRRSFSCRIWARNAFRDSCCCWVSRWSRAVSVLLVLRRARVARIVVGLLSTSRGASAAWGRRREFVLGSPPAKRDSGETLAFPAAARAASPRFRVHGCLAQPWRAPALGGPQKPT